MQIAPLGAFFVFGLINLKMEAFMSKKKSTTSYQFLINEPVNKPAKKKVNFKKRLKELGLNTDNELVIHLFNYLKNKEKKNG